MASLLSPIESLVVLLPALIANGSPVLLASGKPLDLGLTLWDGRRALGDGKTFQGYILGLLYGLGFGLFAAGLASLEVEAYTAPILLSVNGALLGDIVASFAKRRLGLERGAPAPVLDQLDFYTGSLLALYAGGYLLDPLVAITLAGLVYILHRATNTAAYMLGLKDRPW